VPPLRALVDAGHEVRIVVTQADKRRGRGSATTPSPVKAAAHALGLPTSHRVDDVLDSDVELGVVVAFGRLIKPHVLEQVPMINVHFSLLPRWRGAAPVERAILAGDDLTGVGIMQLEEGLDTGPLFAEIEVPIGPEETADELRARLVDAGTALLVDTLSRPLGDAIPQAGDATYASKIDPSELEIDWKRGAADVHRLTRIGRAWTTFRERRLQIVRARLSSNDAAGAPPGALSATHVMCGDGHAIELVTVKPEGRAEQDARAWLNGARPRPGERLGQ
jgi:methionyl-tRNA formyltransferase